MSYRAQALLFFVGLSVACQEPIFIPLESLGEAQMIVAVVVRDGEVVVDSSQIIFPELNQSKGPPLSLEEDEVLALAVFDEAALGRGFLGPVELDPTRISLHAASGVDCGRRGNEVSLDPDGLSRMRQSLGRFAPTMHLLDPTTEAVRAPKEGELDGLGQLEIELPSRAEACLDRWRPRLEPLGRDVSLGDGLFEGGERLHEGFLQGLVGIHVTGDGRAFWMSRHLVVALRRGARFDPAQDDFFRLGTLALPAPEGAAWNLHRMLVAEGAELGTRRIFALVERELDSEITGSALIELPFDGTSFGEPRVRVLFDEPGPTHMQRDALGALVLVGRGGHWAFAPTLDSELITGRLGRADHEALTVTAVPSASHVIALSGGFVGRGDLREPDAFEIRQIREGSAANVLTATVHQGETWIYSGWKDGAVLRSRLDPDTELEPTGLGLPRRLAPCATAEYDQCGRGRAFQRPLALAFANGPNGEGLLVATFEGCRNVVLHELETGCTTGVDFPRLTADDGLALDLHPHGSQLWVTDILAYTEAYTLRIEQGP